MTTTISYHGSTIATIENQAKTLTTAGTYVPYSFIVTDVTSGGGGFTVDDIAMRTISGDISGSAMTIGSYAFYGCQSLITASFPNVTNIGNYAFNSCSALTTISFPSATNIGMYAFNNCNALTTASFPSATSIGMYAFRSCYSLITANFPNVTSIDNSVFYSCTALTTASFPNISYIGTSAFANCYSLTTISFPSATSICSYAFRNCYRLLSLYLLGSSVPTLSIGAFYSTPIGDYTTSTGGVYGSVYVPASLYSSYLTETNWSDIAARIVSVGSSSAIPEALVAKFTKRWYDNGVSAATTAASHYYYLPNTPTSSNGSYVTNLTYQIITSSAFTINIAGKTHFMGEGPCVYLSTALPTDVDYLGSCIFTDPMDSLDESDMTGSFSVSAGNYGNYLTIHTWCEDFSTDFYTIANLATACVSYSGEYYLSKIG